MSAILQYIDLIWLPVGLFSAHKGHRVLTAVFFIACMIMLRLQVELMHSTGYATGILPLLTSDIFIRGVVVYSLFYILFIVMAYYSPGSNKSIFLAASISIFFAAMTASMVVMLL